MRYKLLLTGKNQPIIDDFFYTMSEDFECLTTSLRIEDIVSHINYFQPSAFIYCITEEPRENFMKLITALRQVGKKRVNLILIGDSEECNEFIRLEPDMVRMTLLKPITASEIKVQLLKFLGEQIVQEEREKRESASSSGTKHILIIDDDTRMLRLMKEQLREKYNVATAVSGRIAMNFLERKKTDLILLDYEMPEEDGPAVLEKLRANENTKDIPVVFLTGINDREKIQKVLAMKPQGYLLKPIECTKLIQTIRHVIG